MTRIMYDTVNGPSQIPADAAATAGYTSGNWPNSATLAAAFPHLPHVSIAVTAAHDADCLDVEPGDATIAQAPGWVDRQYARGVAMPIVYTSASNIAALRAALGNRKYLLWSAHYTYNPHVCGSCGYPGADATQFSDRGPGGLNCDSTVMSDAFYAAISGTAAPTATPASTTPAPAATTNHPSTSKDDAMRIINISDGKSDIGQALETSDGVTHLQDREEVDTMTAYIANLNGDPSDVLNQRQIDVANAVFARIKAGK